MKSLPIGINGLKIYEIKDFRQNLDALKDGRKWKKNCPTEWKNHGRVRFADCKGSYKCIQEKCPFKMEFGVTNTTQFEKEGGAMICKGCGKVGEYVVCSARRYLSYRNKSVTVYHIGNHTCPVNDSLRKKDVTSIEQIIRNQPNIKPSEVQSAFVMSAFQQQMDWNAVEREAGAVLDKKRVSNMKQKLKKDIEPFGHNFEAIVSFKEYADKKDPLYVYKMNDKRGNPDMPSFVFKTSTTKMTMALNMDKRGDHFLSKEFCFFDGKRKRCNGFITLTASVYHPLLRKQIPLATMEAETEDTVNVELFWRLFNEALRKVAASDTATFNPLGWCSDMAGANLAGISKVFGDDAEIKSCEFHFKDHRNRKAQRLDSKSGDEFKQLCNRLLLCTTVAGYQAAKSDMDLFIAADDSRAFLTDWVSWWHERRGFIFRAFTNPNAPQMNQAEVIHAGWAHRDRQNLSLLDACQADTRDALLLDVEIKAYLTGATPGGKGPSFADRARKQHEAEVRRAKSTGKEMFSSPDGLLIDAGSSHKPPSRKKKATKSKGPALPPPQVNSQSVNPLSTWQPSYPAPHGAANMIQPRMQTFSQLPAFPQSPSCQGPPFPQPPLQPPSYPQSPMPFADLQPSWNSSMSPSIYELVITPPTVRKCYGCGNDLGDKYKNPPCNIMVKHVDKRVTGKDSTTGQLIHSQDYSNTYYHPIAAHITKKNPLFSGQVYLRYELYTSLDYAQRNYVNTLHSLNIVLK